MMIAMMVVMLISLQSNNIHFIISYITPTVYTILVLLTNQVVTFHTQNGD